MHRRTFINMTAGAATALALKSSVLAGEPEQKNPVVYPDPAVEVVDPRFAKYKVGNAAVERLYAGTRWAEGPVWFADGRYLLFSDIPNNRILRWLEDTGEVSVFRSPSNYSNGNSRDRQGRLITCEHDTRRVTRTEYDGTITVLIDRFQNKKLNAPNDIAVHSDGAIWFTDPGYGIMSNYEGHKASFELPANVYRLDPKTGEATVVAGDMDKPNGLCFSPDEKKLYIADTGAPKQPSDPRPIRVYDVVDGVRLSNELHQAWSRDWVQELVRGLERPCVTLLGLTYKAGTDTLRRSAALELEPPLLGEARRPPDRHRVELDGEPLELKDVAAHLAFGELQDP